MDWLRAVRPHPQETNQPTCGCMPTVRWVKRLIWSAELASPRRLVRVAFTCVIVPVYNTVGRYCTVRQANQVRCQIIGRVVSAYMCLPLKKVSEQGSRKPIRTVRPGSFQASPTYVYSRRLAVIVIICHRFTGGLKCRLISLSAIL